MKKLISIIVVLLLACFISISYAGEKEELAWQVKYYQEKKATLQMQFSLVDSALKEATGKLMAIETAEKAAAKVKADSKKKAKK